MNYWNTKNIKDKSLEDLNEKFEKVNLNMVTVYNNEHKKIDKFIEEKVDYIIDDDSAICVNASNNNIHALYFKNNASDKLEENEYIKNVNNWGEIYRYLMMNENLI